MVERFAAELVDRCRAEFEAEPEAAAEGGTSGTNPNGDGPDAGDSDD